MTRDKTLSILHRVFCAGPLPDFETLIVVLHAVRTHLSDNEIRAHVNGIIDRATLKLEDGGKHMRSQHEWIDL